jgi:aminoglycoside phosphotransferase (APT) family kinase protein
VSETEVPLGGGWTHDAVVRVGDTVRRPPTYATQLMRDVLLHLEAVGFDAAPRWLGFDEQGRDVLSFLEGHTFSDCRQIVWSDEQLAAAGALLRRYHDAVSGSRLAGGNEVVTHGDFGPWNLIWRDGLPRAIIDFDNARPGPRGEDVGYALRAHLNLGTVDLAPGEQARRAHVLAAAYGGGLDLATLLADEYDAAQERCRVNHWLDELARLGEERRWLDENRALL